VPFPRRSRVLQQGRNLIGGASRFGMGFRYRCLVLCSRIVVFPESEMKARETDPASCPSQPNSRAPVARSALCLSRAASPLFPHLGQPRSTYLRIVPPWMRARVSSLHVTMINQTYVRVHAKLARDSKRSSIPRLAFHWLSSLNVRSPLVY